MTTSNRSLVPLSRSLPARRPPLALVAAQRMLPAAGRTLAAAAVGLAAEYMLRAVANRALGSVARPAAPTAPRTTRTVITEFVIIERVRRL
jgi:hypothetical protein